MKILHLDSSPLGVDSASRLLGGKLVDSLRKTDNEVSVTYRDLAAHPPQHLDGAILQSLRPAAGAGPQLTAQVRQELALTDALIDELLNADVLVLGAPMYNFSVPSQLKAWIDRVCQRERTFRYTAQGPVGLVGDKKTFIISTRGGYYAGTPKEHAIDHQEAYLRTILNFFGIQRITVIRAEGLNVGPDAKKKALDDASGQIAALVAGFPG